MTQVRGQSALPGFSLIEMAIIMMLMSLAMVPMVMMIGGNSTSLGTGDAQKSGSGTRLIGVKTKEVVFANSLMERALAGDATVFNVQANGGNCASASTIPAPNSGGQAIFNCVDNVSYRDRIYYQWIVQDRASEFPGNTPTEDKMRNAFYRATLNIYNNDTWTGTPAMTMPTMTFTNITPPDEESTTAGVVVVLDISGSMAWAAQNNANKLDRGTYYRYPWPGYTPPTAGMNLFNNSQLDLMIAAPTDDPLTLYDDRYPRNTILGMTKCGSASPGGPADPIFHNVGFGGNLYTGTNKTALDNLCDGTPGGYGSDAMYDLSLSRIEAARNSLLSFLVELEADQTLRDSIQLGFVTYEGNTITNKYPTAIGGALESPSAANVYVNMRNQFSWINRRGVNAMQILPGGVTPTWQGVNRAAQMLYAQPNLNERAILLLTDGLPNSSHVCDTDPGSTAESITVGLCYRDRNTNGVNGLGRSLGNGTFPGANGQPIRVYALGILANETWMTNVLQTGLTDPTNGTFKSVSSVGQIKTVFDDIKYQLFKQILLSKADRYGINLN